MIHKELQIQQLQNPIYYDELWKYFQLYAI